LRNHWIAEVDLEKSH